MRSSVVGQVNRRRFLAAFGSSSSSRGGGLTLARERDGGGLTIARGRGAARVATEEETAAGIGRDSLGLGCRED
ncbi:hypothetical protein ABZP36_023235 [Zizania latifolia]